MQKILFGKKARPIRRRIITTHNRNTKDTVDFFEKKRSEISGKTNDKIELKNMFLASFDGLSESTYHELTNLPIITKSELDNFYDDKSALKYGKRGY